MRTILKIAAVLALVFGNLVYASPPDPTSGGKGGKIIRVTTLAKDGPGSLAEALAAKGPRIIVFEVGGAIDLERSTLEIAEPFVTIAGQTAPSPGITILRGGIDVKTHDVLLQHLRVVVGSDGLPKRHGWEVDAFSTRSAHNVVIENNSFFWAIDENMSASGPRFTGDTVEEWREGTSRNIVFRSNLAAEGLADSTHPKGEHSKGSLIHDNATGIVFEGNIWAHNVERSPLLKGGVEALMINNLIYDPQYRAVHYNLMDLEWAGHGAVDGKLTAVGNVLRGGNSTDDGLPFLTIGGVGDLLYYGHDNVAVDRYGSDLPMFGRYGVTSAEIKQQDAPLHDLSDYTILPSIEVETHLLATAGARPWDRSEMETRVLFFIAEGRGEIIDSESEVGGYPEFASTKAPFVAVDWNLSDMTTKSGVMPGQKAGAQEHLSPRDREMRESNK
ncbi:pectate lyase family protein [Pontixanthobacter aquaemixtae]|uniref:Pectate lyase n=1 Tax=Pontixanthobacter aquaemixtae TaxID=1958940 RepID=A0A844ZRB2_9SPHN|nr:pectate lyase [Pontixanthobacter aquaemixtae]MXO90373.1 pectate lyase [Pontixanthobacter aquaemixtae]